MSVDPGHVTQLLISVRQGSGSAAAALMPLVYEELRGLAGALLRGQSPDITLQPTALVHEAYMRLAGAASADWRDRAHFFAVAARAMRQVLIDHARARGAEKRGGRRERVSLEQNDAAELRPFDLVSLNDALTSLGELDENQARVVELRFFGGMTNDEVALVLDRSTRTVEREWRAARAWLRRELAARGDD